MKSKVIAMALLSSMSLIGCTGTNKVVKEVSPNNTFEATTAVFDRSCRISGAKDQKGVGLVTGLATALAPVVSDLALELLSAHLKKVKEGLTASTTATTTIEVSGGAAELDDGKEKSIGCLTFINGTFGKTQDGLKEEYKNAGIGIAADPKSVVEMMLYGRKIDGVVYLSAKPVLLVYGAPSTKYIGKDETKQLLISVALLKPQKSGIGDADGGSEQGSGEQGQGGNGRDGVKPNTKKSASSGKKPDASTDKEEDGADDGNNQKPEESSEFAFEIKRIKIGSVLEGASLSSLKTPKRVFTKSSGQSP